MGMKRSVRPLSPSIFCCLALLGGCEVLVDFDRGMIDEGSGGQQSTGGQPDTGGVSNDDDASVALPDADVADGDLPEDLVAVDDQFNIESGWALSVSDTNGVLNNDQSGGASLTAELVTGPATGTLALNAGGGFNFSAPPLDLGDNASIDITFTYVARDGMRTSNEATVTITVRRDAAPTAPDLEFATAGNTQIAADAGALLQGAEDPEGHPLSVIGGTSETALLGSVTVEADGSFVYTPLTGRHAVRPASTTEPTVLDDSFTYTIYDGTNQVTKTATVHLGEELIWYVDNAAMENGDGSSAAPFNDLHDAEAVSKPGETLYLRVGEDTYPDVALKAGQRLIGAGIELKTVVGETELTLLPAGTAPALYSTGDVITLARGAEVAGIHVEDRAATMSAAGNAISGTAIGDVRLHDLVITGRVARGLWLDSIDGLIEVTNVAITGPLSAGVVIQNSSADTALSDLQIRDAFQGDTQVTLGVAPAPGAALELRHNTGPLQWHDGGVSFSAANRVHALYAEDITDLTLSGSSAGSFDIAGAGSGVSSGVPVTSVWVQNARAFRATRIAVHDQAPALSISAANAQGAIRLQDVTSEVVISESSFGAVMGLGSNRAHGVQVVNGAATEPLVVTVTQCSFGGSPTSAAELRRALSVSVVGDGNSHAEIDFSGNQLDYADEGFYFRAESSAPLSTPHLVRLDQNTASGMSKDGVVLLAAGNASIAAAITDNDLLAASTANVGISAQAQVGASASLELTVTGNQVRNFQAQGILISAHPGQMAAAALIDGNSLTREGTVSSSSDAGILLRAAAWSSLDATVTGNAIRWASGGYSILAQTYLTGAPNVCLDVRGTNDGDGAGPLPVYFDGTFGTAFESAQASQADFQSANAGVTVYSFPSANAGATCTVP